MLLAVFARALIGEFFVLCLLYISYVLSTRLLRNHSGSARWCGMYIIVCWILSVVFHILITCRVFSLLPAACLIGVLGYFTWYFQAVPRANLFELFSEPRELFSAFKPANGSYTFLLLFPFLLLATILLARVLLLPLMGWDTLTYHGIKAAWWVQTGRDIQYYAPGGWEYYRSYFAGGEIFTSWAMLIFHSDLLAGLPDLVHWIGLGLVSYSIAREFGSPRWLAAALSIMLLGTPDVSRYVGSGYVDTCNNAMLLGGALFLCRYFRRQQAGELILASAALGIALSVKITALAVTLLLGSLSIIWILSHPRTRNRVWRNVFISAVVFLLPFVRWCILNYWESGYPLGFIPLAIGPVRLGLSPPNFAWFLERPWLPDRPDLIAYSLKSEFRALIAALRPFTFFLAFSGLGLFGLISHLRQRTWQVLVLLCTMVGVVAYYFSPSFSAIRLGWGGVNGRFLFPAVAGPAIAGLGWLVRKQTRSALLYIFICASICLNICWYLNHFLMKAPVEEQTSLIFTLGFILLSILAIYYCVVHPLRKRPIISYAAIALFLSLALMCVQLTRNWLRCPAYRSSMVLHDFPRYWVDALCALEKEAGERVIAVTAGPEKISHKWFVFPFMGSTFANRICYVTPERNGRILAHHPETLVGAEPDFNAWIRRLKERGVTHVMSFMPPTVELNWMEMHRPIFTRMAGSDHEWGLFRFEDHESEGRLHNK